MENINYCVILKHFILLNLHKFRILASILVYLLDFAATAKGAKNCSFSIVSESSPIRKGPDTDAIYSDDMYTPNGYPVYAKDLEKLVTFYSELKLKKEKNTGGKLS